MGTLGIKNVQQANDFNNIGNVSAIGGQQDAEFALYDRARSADAHVLLDFTNVIVPLAYFEKFDSKSKTEIIYRHPIGSKVPIGETKPGGWDLTFNNGLMDDAMFAMFDTIHKQRFDGNATPRLTVAQRIKFSQKMTRAENAKSNGKQNVIYIYYECVLGGYSLNDPGEGNPLEESCSGYARFRTYAP